MGRPTPEGLGPPTEVAAPPPGWVRPPPVLVSPQILYGHLPLQFADGPGPLRCLKNFTSLLLK